MMATNELFRTRDSGSMSSLMITVLAGSAVLGFQSFNRALDWMSAGRAKPCGKYLGKERHKWRNAATSLLNSVIMSGLVFSSFYWHPALRTDLVHYWMQLGDITLAILVGYYIYDLYDLVSYNKFTSIWPLIAHHSTGVGILTLVMYYQIGIGVVFAALLCEVNAILLHLRQVLLMHGVSRHSTVFHIVKVLNVTTFVTFRLLPLLYAGYYSWTVELPAILAFTSPICGVFIISLNFALFRRVLFNDFIRRDNNNKWDEACIMDR